MLLEVKAPWRHSKDEVEDDKKFLRNLFQLNHSFGLEGVVLSDHKEWRATANIETNDYIVSGSQQ